MTFFQYLLLGWRSDFRGWAVTWALLLILAAGLVILALAALGPFPPEIGTLVPFQ